MIDTTLTSTLFSSYKLNQSNHTSSLLSPSASSLSQTQNTLLAGIATKSDSLVSNSSLIDFVNSYAPENTKLLSDIAAVNALGNLFSQDAPQSNAFFNTYSQVLLTTQENLTADSQFSLESSFKV